MAQNYVNHLLLKATDRTHGGKEVRVCVRVYSGNSEQDNTSVYFTVDGFYDPDRNTDNNDLFYSVDYNKIIENERLGAQLRRDEKMLYYFYGEHGKCFRFTFEYNGIPYSCIYITKHDSESVRIGSTNEIDVSGSKQIYSNSIEKSIKKLEFVVD